MEIRTARFVLIALLLITAAVVFQNQFGSDARADDQQDAAVGLAVANSELYSVREDLRLWRELENQNINNEALKQIVTNNLIRHVMMVRAANIDIRELTGTPLEALCLLTTEEVKGILGQSKHEDLSNLALDFINSIEQDVLDLVREIQKGLLGTGCNLSPGDPHF